jgi:hypothetical protein
MIAVFHRIDASNCFVERRKIAPSPDHRDKMAAGPLPVGRLKMKSFLAARTRHAAWHGQPEAKE